MKDFVWLGTKLKYLVEITAGGFSMENDDFNIVLSVGRKTRKFEKNELVNDGEHFYLVFDTAEFCIGELNATVTAYVPDTDFPDNIRTEVYKVRLTTIQS